MTSEITIRQFKSLKENKELRNQAMAMYMSGEFYPTEICDRLLVDIEELGILVFGRDRLGTSKSCWKYLKDSGQVPKFVSVYEKIKPLYIKKTEKKILDTVNRLLDNYADDEDGKVSEKIDDMDTKDLNNLVSAMEKIDKIGRLEEGKATTHTITERTSYSLREIVAKKKADAAEIVDAEFKEIPKIKMPTGRGSE